jgi:type IV pilus assembly protein PilV
MNTKYNRFSRSQRGFSLVEVLVALIVMSVGMLGIASLYVQSMQAGRTSMFRHSAVTLAGDVAERLRANPTAGALYEGAGADNGCIATGVTCDETEMAAQDILVWQQQAAGSLPGGAVLVTYDGAVFPPSYTIQVGWNEPEGAQQYTVTIPVLELL